MAERDIFVTDTDFDRLNGLVAGARRSRMNQEHVDRLAEELDRARIVSPEEIPPDVVTMNSRIQLRDLDTNDAMEFVLVFPTEANVDEQRISVLAPLGTAVLGYRAGSIIEWQVPARTRRLRIERVLYQPEAAASAGHAR
ncbi:MAG TPA: nucleoside diphosphate kinase regulator [Vicinamibacterales bacterium]|nr:nucleoside diphosphate kinase regulator [Vicinamibacterales bacterium]